MLNELISSQNRCVYQEMAVLGKLYSKYGISIERISLFRVRGMLAFNEKIIECEEKNIFIEQKRSENVETEQE